jgi:hypothetical protein
MDNREIRNVFSLLNVTLGISIRRMGYVIRKADTTNPKRRHHFRNLGVI